MGTVWRDDPAPMSPGMVALLALATVVAMVLLAVQADACVAKAQGDRQAAEVRCSERGAP